MKKIIFIILMMCCHFCMAQKPMEMIYITEITVNDTCVRIYNIKNFKTSDPARWYHIAENLYHIVLTKMEPENLTDNDSLYREYRTRCDNVIFYCLDDFDYINHPITKELLSDESFRKKIICKHIYKTLEDPIVDPFHYNIYKE